MVQPHHVSLNEALVRLHQSHAVLRNQVDVWQKQLGGHVRQRFVHGNVKDRVSHDRREFFNQIVDQPLRQQDNGEHAPRNGDIG